MNKVWFDLKETNTDSESNCFHFQRFQKENITFNENASRYETNNFDLVGNIYYLPHRPVVKDDRVTSKVRIMFDANSKIEGPLLNDCLYLGP